MSKTGNVPKFVQDAPEVEMGNEFLLISFFRLSSHRPLGFGGEGPIPWREMWLYCRDMGLGPEEAEEACDILRMVDNAYMEIVAEKAKRK